MPISIPLQLKRTTSANRTSYTPKDGEPIVEKDTQQLYIGDGSTPGGYPLGAPQGNSIPSGAILIFPTETPPSGFLECNGAAVSRTTYADLFAVIGTTYGSGNGSTTFNIPDYRGYFLRATNHGSGRDPDVAARTNRGDGTTGDKVGTKQHFQIQSHTHGNVPLRVTDTDRGGWSSQYSVDNHSNTAATGGNETRPRNINVLYCIAY